MTEDLNIRVGDVWAPQPMRAMLIDLIENGICDRIDMDTGPQNWAEGALDALAKEGLAIVPAARIAELEALLRECTDWMEDTRASGDCGFWDWCPGDEYNRARTALAAASSGDATPSSVDGNPATTGDATTGAGT